MDREGMQVIGMPDDLRIFKIMMVVDPALPLPFFPPLTWGNTLTGRYG